MRMERQLTPIQMPHVDMDEVKNGRKAFTKEEWMDILLRSTGMEPDKLSDRATIYIRIENCVSHYAMIYLLIIQVEKNIMQMLFQAGLGEAI